MWPTRPPSTASVAPPSGAAIGCGCSCSGTGCAVSTWVWPWPPPGSRCRCARPTPRCAASTNRVNRGSSSAVSTTGRGWPKTPTRCCLLPEGAVVLRSADAELRLQALRTALSLALGDRAAGVFILGAGAGVLSVEPAGEAGRCLDALRQAEIPIRVEAETGPPAGGTSSGPRLELLREIAASSFQQTF